MTDSAPPPGGPQAPPHLFGQIAQELGLLKPEQVEIALRIQSEMPKLIGARRKIGEILHDRHELELRAVQKILLEQRRRRDKDGVAADAMAAAGNDRKIGIFEIQAVLGSGGMGHVYKARDSVQDRVVALKVLSLCLTDDTEFLARFKREVQACSSLAHPNIVAGFGSGSVDGRPYMTMEFVEGRSLGKILEAEHHLPERRALEIAREVARALEYAHGQGVVHRDVKPDNVLVGEKVTKLTDFGLAKLLQDDQRLTQSGIALGTPHYISPEQVEASRYIDHRADLYGLGAMLFHMLTGKVPFEGETNNEIMLKHLHEPLRDLRSLVPGISSAAAQIVQKLMAKKAAERYDSAAQLLEDVDLVLAGKKPLHAARAAAHASKEKSGCALGVLFAFVTILYLAK